MKTLHMPHFHLPRRSPVSEAEHHHEPMWRWRRMEGALDYMVIGGVLALLGAMAFAVFAVGS